MLYFTQSAVEHRKLSKKKKAKKISNAICENITKKEFDVNGFHFKLAYSSTAIFTKTSLEIISRILIDNDPGESLLFVKAIDQGGPHIPILQDKCGTETTAPAFSACAKLILAEQKICTPDTHGSLIYEYLDDNTIECAVMLFAMSFFEVGIAETGTNCEVPY